MGKSWLRAIASCAALAVLLSFGVVVTASSPAHAEETGTPVLVASAPSENVLLSGDGSYVVYSSGGVLYGETLPGGATQALSQVGPDGSRVDVNADGSVVVFIAAGGDAHVVSRLRGIDEVIATGLASTDRIHVAASGASVWYTKALSSGTALYSHDAAVASSGPDRDSTVPVGGSVAAFAVDGHAATVAYNTDAGDLRRYTLATGADELLTHMGRVRPDDLALSGSGRYLAYGYVIADLVERKVIVDTTGTGEALSTGGSGRFSLDEQWLVVSGTSRGGVWMVPVQGGQVRRVTHAVDLGYPQMFPVSADATGATVAYSSVVSSNGPQYAAYMAPVVFDQQAPEVTPLTGEGAVLRRQSITAHVTDGGSGVGYVDIDATSPAQSLHARYRWSDLVCHPDDAGFHDDRDCEASIGPLSDGAWTVTFRAVDVDGNRAAPQTVHVTYDNTAPTVTGTPDRPANSHGWYRAPVTIIWNAADANGPASVPSASTVTSDGQGQLVTSGASCDQVGNCATGTYRVSIDQTAPILTMSPDRAPDANGWYRSPVTVTFGCTDTLSGVTSCPARQTISTEGRNQQVSGTTEDLAGNTTTRSLSVSYDGTAPTGAYTSSPLVLRSMGQRLTGVANDALSGVSRLELLVYNGAQMYYLSTDDGSITMTCGQPTACTWSAALPSGGLLNISLHVFDIAGNGIATNTDVVAL